ncbi:alpha/beta fold hydrolase [Maioricimonas sp. JC845]|uniref:alpha/beta hydrolase family protein n=1 Tax=Maioricimonas sp. JC845 TaxID=3232138 RepID=UPI003457F548
MIRLLLPVLCLALFAGSRLPAAEPTGEVPHQRLLFYTDDAGNEQPVRTKADWEIRRRQILQGMQEATGPLPSRDNLTSLDIEVLETVPGDGYERQTIRFTPEQGDRLTAYLYIPKGASADDPRPGIVALHPTHRIGKGVVDGQSERPNRAYGKELAERGYVVIAPDYISFGDSADYDFENDRYRTGTMKGIWNHMRCVDLLLERDDVMGEKIGTIGHSLGGHNAIFLGVFDQRVKAIVSSCGWTPFHDYYGGKIAGWTSDRYMPSLKTDYDLDPDRVPFDFYELVAALAPRPFFSNSPLYDSNFDYRGVEKAAPKARRVYELYDAANNLRVAYPNAQHDFPPAVRFESYEFLDAHLGHSPRNVDSAPGNSE